MNGESTGDGSAYLLDGLSVGSIQLGSRRRGPKSDLSASKIGNVDEPQVPCGISGSLKQGACENCPVGDLVEFSGVVVVEYGEETECILDGCKRAFVG